MNFHLVENQYVDWGKIEEDFTNQYLWSSISNEDLRKQYNMSHGEFRRYCKYVRDKHGLNRRPFWKHRSGGVKYYYQTKNGFVILKRDGDKNIYFGFVPTEEVAMKVVEMCKQTLWDIGVSWLIVHNWRCIVN